MYSGDGCLLGFAVPSETFEAGSLYLQDVLPNEKIAFIAYSEIPFEEVDYWEYDLVFEIKRIEDTALTEMDEDTVLIEEGEDTPTAVKQATWGGIKAAIMPQ